MDAGALVYRAFLTVLVGLVALLAYQVLSATTSSLAMRERAVAEWSKGSDFKRGYGDEFISECGGGFSVLLERRYRHSNPESTGCAGVLAKSDSPLRFGLSETEALTVDAWVQAEFAKHPIPAPLSWL
jgi:hypothetical protein